MSVSKVGAVLLLLIFVLLTQTGCSVVHTAVGSFVGTLSADLVNDELEKDDDDETPQP